jgi:hypothetical protein
VGLFKVPVEVDQKPMVHEPGSGTGGEQSRFRCIVAVLQVRSKLVLGEFGSERVPFATGDVPSGVTKVASAGGYR